MEGNRDLLISFIVNTHPSLSKEKAVHLASYFHRLSLKKGDLFLKTRDVCDSYLFLEEGFLRSYLYDTEGTEVTLSFYPPRSVVFEVSSFFQRIPSAETIEALTDCYGWALSFDEVNKLFHNIPEFREFGRALLVKGYIAFKQRTLSMINQTAEQRYERLLTSNPEIFQYAPLKHVASYLGITDSSLSRIRREFTKK